MSFGESDSRADYRAAVTDSVEIGKRLRSLREDRKLTQAQFASRLGVTRGAVGNWERGLGIKFENIQTVATTFRVSVEWLASGKGQSYAPTPKEASKATEPANAIVGDRVREPFQYIPLYGHAVGGADGEYVLNGNKLDDIPAPPGLYASQDAYAVTVAGDSVEPRYYDGETVYVDPGHRVRRGDYVVAQIKHDAEDGSPPLAYIKRFIRHSDVELVLEQLNPAKELRFPHDRVVSVHYIAFGGPGNLKYR